MASRRMFALDVVDTDLFLNMPAAARLLYFDLGMRADDDGFVSSAQRIVMYTGAAQEDLELLIEKGYVLRFDSGILAIRHWRVNNQIKPDRYKPTLRTKEKAMISLNDAKEYVLDCGTNLEPNWNQTGSKMEPNWNQTGSKVEPIWNQSGTILDPNWNQSGSTGKVRLGKVRLGEVTPGEGSASAGMKPAREDGGKAPAGAIVKKGGEDLSDRYPERF